MNHPWQQPIRPLEYLVREAPPGTELRDYHWVPVLFIRPCEYGWEIIGIYGTRWTDRTAMIREVAQ